MNEEKSAEMNEHTEHQWVYKIEGCNLALISTCSKNQVTHRLHDGGMRQQGVKLEAPLLHVQIGRATVQFHQSRGA
jgi:hypothetical protein